MILTAGLAACGEDSSFNKSYESRFAEAAINSCKSEVSDTVSDDLVDALCKCYVSELIKKYDALDLATVDPEKETAIAEDCAQRNGL